MLLLPFAELIWVILVDDVVNAAERRGDLHLVFHLERWWDNEDPKPALQNANDSFHNVTQLRVTEVEIFLCIRRPA